MNQLPIDELIALRFVEIVRSIREDAGYSTTIRHVNRFHNAAFDANLYPFASVYDPVDTPKPDETRSYGIEEGYLTIVIEAWTKAKDFDSLARVLNLMKADIYVATMLDHTLGGLAIRTVRGIANKILGESEKAEGGVRQEFIVQYRFQYGRPHQSVLPTQP